MIDPTEIFLTWLCAVCAAVVLFGIILECPT